MDRLSRLHKAVLLIYLVISVLILIILNSKILSRESLNILIFFYGFGTAFGLLIAYMKELRNNLNYMIWVGIGFIHFLIFEICKNDLYFNIRNYNANQNNWVSFADKTSSLSTDTLKGTIIVLVSIKIFEWIFQRITNKQLIGTYCRFSWYSAEDNRPITWLDVFFNIILYFITLFAVLIKI
jgi:multidrug transporter EmrE-like cation transporter